MMRTGSFTTDVKVYNAFKKLVASKGYTINSVLKHWVTQAVEKQRVPKLANGTYHPSKATKGRTHAKRNGVRQKIRKVRAKETPRKGTRTRQVRKQAPGRKKVRRG